MQNPNTSLISTFIWKLVNLDYQHASQHRQELSLSTSNCEVAHISKFCLCLSREDANHLKTKTQCHLGQIKCAKQQVNII